jgi:hypothetical protein
MDALNPKPDAYKRRIFVFREPLALTAASDLDLIVQSNDGRSLVLSGPSAKIDPQHRPVRGDLAHIRCAGTVFVPHYAVPMPHRAVSGALLRKAAQAEGDVIAELAIGEIFNVLDMSGGWAWGQQGEDGFVGYVLLSALAAV